MDQLDHIIRTSAKVSVSQECMRPSFPQVLDNIVVPSIKWKSGHPAALLRRHALQCLHTILDLDLDKTRSIIVDHTSLVDMLISTLSDDVEEIRQLTLENLNTMVQRGHCRLTGKTAFTTPRTDLISNALSLNNIFIFSFFFYSIPDSQMKSLTDALRERMDDSSNDLRIMAIELFGHVVGKTQESKENAELLPSLDQHIDALRLQVDDDDIKVEVKMSAFACEKHRYLYFLCLIIIRRHVCYDECY